MVVRVMSFPATEYQCDTVLAIALQSIYQLCAKTNGRCRNGACTDETCIQTVDNPCTAQNDITDDASFIIAALAGVTTILFLWAWTAIAISEDKLYMSLPNSETMKVEEAM
jgi:hypothetical protein